MPAPDTLYLKIDQNVVVQDYQVHLQDIASMECTNEAVLRQLKQKKIYTFQAKDTPKQKKKRMQVFSVLKIIQSIHEDYPELNVENLGESDFIIECNADVVENKMLDIIKTAVLCVVIFFGAAFTIMTFNNDVAVSDVFQQLYSQIIGKQSDGVTEIEICYAIGMPVGIIIFYNHIGKKKITQDPTPIEVEMRKYEQDVDTAFIENASREGSSVEVS
ncbi:MAG: stage V sporulation protein AA [Eubacterium sp.]|jgi:stage V sporulation protein AA|nr:stage V sporulation protein AA [Eubacterium sp.]